LRVYERRQQKLYKAKELIEHKELGIRIDDMCMSGDHHYLTLILYG
jgi:hypothetical protein